MELKAALGLALVTFVSFHCAHKEGSATFVDTMSAPGNEAKTLDPQDYRLGKKSTYSPSEDQKEIDALRKEIPKDKRVENDEIGFTLGLMSRTPLMPPSDVRSKFQNEVRAKRDKFFKAVRKEQDLFQKQQREEREGFLKLQSKEREEYKKEKATSEERKEFYSRQEEHRKEFFEKSKERSDNFRDVIREKQLDFEVYMKDAQSRFETEYRDYSNKYKEQEKARTQRSGR